MKKFTTLLLLLPTLLTAQPVTPINATGLKSATTNVNVSAAAAPVAGQVLTATAGTTATWQTPLSGATLNGITAATGNQAGIANGDFNVRWNWAKTTDSQTAFEFGESAASTGGTSTSGVPNQVIGKFSTLAASTASPFSVYVRGIHLISASPSTTQLLAANGSAAAPVLAFANSTTTGFYRVTSDAIGVSSGGVAIARFTSGGGTFGTLSLANLTGAWGDVAALGTVLSVNSGTSNVGNLRLIYANAGDNTPGTVTMLRSRGTPTAPTVITSGDNLGKLRAHGYVGATSEYVEAANITFDSTGTITDSTTGVGGIIRLSARVSGAALGEVANFSGTGFTQAAGQTYSISSGTNQRAGNAVLVAGTVTVANTTVSANTVVMLTRKTAGGALGNLTYTLSAATSFTINSDNAGDTSTVSYFLIEVP